MGLLPKGGTCVQKIKPEMLIEGIDPKKLKRVLQTNCLNSNSLYTQSPGLEDSLVTSFAPHVRADQDINVRGGENPMSFSANPTCLQRDLLRASATTVSTSADDWQLSLFCFRGASAKTNSS